MEDLNHALCKVLQELVCKPVDSLTEFSNGSCLSSLLHCIDALEFSAKDRSLNSWSISKTRLEAFLARKGLSDQSLDFDLESIAKSELEALVSAFLQILAILGAFGSAQWERALSAVDYVSRASLKKFLENMISEIKQELTEAEGRTKSGSLDNSAGIKSLLQKLERLEGVIEGHEKEICKLRAELAFEQAEKQKAIRAGEAKDRELLEMQMIKAEALKLLESNYSSRPDRKSDDESDKKIKRLSSEIDSLNDKLLETRAILLDKDNEIDKLRLIQAFLEEKKTELDEASQQLDHYKRLTDGLKKEREICDSKLKCFEFAEKNIRKLKEMLKEEKERTMGLKLKAAEAEQTIESLQRRLGTSEDKLVILRKSMLNSSGVETVEPLALPPYAREMEEENSRLKQQLKHLLQIQNELEMKSFADELREKEAEIMQGKIRSLLLENQHLALQREKEKQGPSLELTEDFEERPAKFFEAKEGTESVVLQHVSTGDFSWENKELLFRPRSNSEKGDDSALLYSAMMGFFHRELLQRRVLVPNRLERTREIFKPFRIGLLKMT